jgi:hypothetical protein
MEADKFILEKQITELLRINKIQAGEIEELKKQSEQNKLDRVTNRVDKLILDKKIKSADRDKEIKFTLGLNENLAKEYFEKLETSDDVIDLSTKSITNFETTKAKEEK